MFKEPMKYLKKLKEAGANLDNIKNWASHYLYGTNPESLAKMSKQGIVYNPPSH